MIPFPWFTLTEVNSMTTFRGRTWGIMAVHSLDGIFYIFFLLGIKPLITELLVGKLDQVWELDKGL